MLPEETGACHVAIINEEKKINRTYLSKLPRNHIQEPREKISQQHSHSPTAMKEEVDQLLLSLQRLLDSCADHDILYDIFVSPADPAAYRDALDDISRITGEIRESGIGRDELLEVISGASCAQVPALEGMVATCDLVPLMGAGFSREQDELVRDACRRWAAALDPCDTSGTEALLAEAIRPLTLADLLAPENTRMLRFPAILRIQEMADFLSQEKRAAAGTGFPGEVHEPGTRGAAEISGFAAGYPDRERMAIVPSGDRARFAGYLYQGIFAFLVQRGLIPGPLFPDTLFQSLFDLGVLLQGSPDHEGSSSAGQGLAGVPGGFPGVCPEEAPCSVRLMEEGRALAEVSGALDDIRTLYRISLRSMALSGGAFPATGRHHTGERKEAMGTTFTHDPNSRNKAGARECPGLPAATFAENQGRTSPEGPDTPSGMVESAAGHVLAGWAIAGAPQYRQETPIEQKEADDERLLPHAVPFDADPGVNAIRQVLSFVRGVASRPTGRAAPGPGRVRALDRIIREMEHLLRVLTGDYAWKAVAYPYTAEGFRPPVDLLPDRHFLLYDREELAFRDVEPSLALLMEAFYRCRFGPSGYEDDPWLSRLALVIGTRRAVHAGLSCHPGGARWMKSLADEEADPASRLAGKVSTGRLPLPDQFLAGALYEGRTGRRTDTVTDPMVLFVLDSTRASRIAAADPGLTGEQFSTLLREEIRPVFGQLLREPAGYTGEGTMAATPGKSPGGPAISPRGTAPRVDASVPHSTFPDADTPGRVIEGVGAGLLGDDGFQVPGAGSGTGTGRGAAETGRGGIQGGPAREGEKGSVPPGSPDQHPARGETGTGPGDRTGAGQDTVSRGLQEPGTGIRETMESLVSACTRGLEMVKGPGYQEPGEDEGEQAGMGRRDQRSGGEDRAAGTGREGAKGTGPASLNDLAGEIDDLANTLEKQIGALSEEISREEGAMSRTRRPGLSPGKGKELDALLKTSEKVSRAAGEFRKAVNDLEREIRETGAGPGRSRTRTGMTEKALMDLMDAGIEFQRIAGASFLSGAGSTQPAVKLPENSEEEAPAQPPHRARTGPVAPAFVADNADSAEVWESLSYFDASYGDDEPEEEHVSSGLYTRGTAEQRYVQGEQALTHEAARYLSALQQRTRSEWESIEEKAERIRQIALYETNAVGEDDFAMYQRFYQPVAGLVGVARKNIQQALQKNRATRDLTELASGDDIDEENLAAVRTTMRIFKDSGKQEDRARWCLSLLLDASSSMHDETVAKKLEATIRTAILFGEALNRVQGITYEIAAFADTEYIPLKRYQDDWNIHQGCYLIRQLIQASGGTNDVGAVGSALDRMNRLRSASGANKMIFVISDGQSGVGGREQMRKILAIHKEVRIFGWGIGPDMEKIEETYRPYGTHVREIADLPRSLGEVLRRELGRPAMAGWKEERPGTAAGGPATGEASCTD